MGRSKTMSLYTLYEDKNYFLFNELRHYSISSSILNFTLQTTPPNPGFSAIVQHQSPKNPDKKHNIACSIILECYNKCAASIHVSLHCILKCEIRVFKFENVNRRKTNRLG
ncbi:hypothetical protein ACJX0J_016502, partial [Zea mays]